MSTKCQYNAAHFYRRRVLRVIVPFHAHHSITLIPRPRNHVAAWQPASSMKYARKHCALLPVNLRSNWKAGAGELVILELSRCSFTRTPSLQ